VYARFSTIDAQTSAIDAGIAHVRDEVMTALQHLDGFVGLSLLVNRTTGRCLATSAWQTQEAMRASAEAVGPIRNRAAEVFGGSAQVEEFEIALMHRAHRATTGACVRGSWLTCDASKLDKLIDTFRMATLPKVEDISGFCSASMFVNRESGLCVVSVTYDDQNALEASRETAISLRTSIAAEVGGDIQQVTEFELAFAHLHVPELV